MRIYLRQNVWDSAIKRLEYIFNEFENVIICTSGGKDSTITKELALIVAEKMGRLPVKMIFIDQEVEYRHVIEYMRRAMADPRIEPIWIQCPIKMPNSLSASDPIHTSWEPGKDWMRPKENFSIKENVFGVDNWNSNGNEIFTGILKHYFPDQKSCYLAGVRAEESPARFAGLTTGNTYKHITYGKALNKKLGHYTFYPLYDWCLSDVWKAIHDNNWDYCGIYDELYRYGVAPHRMRVSSLHHETAVHSLFFLQEIEYDTWEAMVKRLGGINQASHMEKTEMLMIDDLPHMFKDWREFRDYLSENLILDEETKEIYRVKHKRMDKYYADMLFPEDLIKRQIRGILVNDYKFVKLSNFLASPPMIAYLEFKRGKLAGRPRTVANMKYIKPEYRGGVTII